jgi:hypothetical protein
MYILKYHKNVCEKDCLTIKKLIIGMVKDGACTDKCKILVAPGRCVLFLEAVLEATG